MLNYNVNYEIVRIGEAAGRTAANKRPVPSDLFDPVIPEGVDPLSYLKGYWRGLESFVSEKGFDVSEQIIAKLRADIDEIFKRQERGDQDGG